MEFLWQNCIKSLTSFQAFSSCRTTLKRLPHCHCTACTACVMLDKYYFKFWVLFPHFETLNPALCNVVGVNGLWCAIEQNQQAPFMFKSISEMIRSKPATVCDCKFVCLQYTCRIGTVHRITDRGDVRVQYSNNIRWTFHPGALTKVL